MLLPGRTYSATSAYRYGFNGKEQDSAINGNGVDYDYGFRVYDARIGKFLSVDPLVNKYPWYTPYQFAGNKPIIAVDLDGKEEKIVIRHLAIHNGTGEDGSFFIKSTEVTVDHNAIFFEYGGGKVVQKAVTQIYAEYQGQTTQIGYLEENVVPGGMKPSAEYDYTQNVIPGKPTDDAKYEGWNPYKWWQIAKRDYNAPDNAETVSDLEDLGTALLTQVSARALLKRNGGIEMSATKPPANIQTPKGYTVNSSKFNYFFGKVVTGAEHNITRSAQNLKDLTTLGIENENRLIGVFNEAIERGSIVSTKTSQYGTTIMKSVNIGNKGSIDVGFFYAGGDMSSTPSVTTIIPKIFK